MDLFEKKEVFFFWNSIYHRPGLCFELCRQYRQSLLCSPLSGPRVSFHFNPRFNFQFSREPRNYPGSDDAAGDNFPRPDQHSQHDTNKQSQGILTMSH